MPDSTMLTRSNSLASQTYQRDQIAQKQHPVSNDDVPARANLSTMTRLNKVRVKTVPPVARAWAHTGRHISNICTLGFSYVERKTSPSKNVQQLNKQRAQAMKWMKSLGLLFDLGALASGIASIVAPPAQAAALSFFLAELVCSKSIKYIAQLAINDLQEHLKTDPNENHLMDAADLMSKRGLKFIQTDQGLATKTDLYLRAYAVAKGKHKAKAVERAENGLRNKLFYKSIKRDMKAQLGLINLLPESIRVSSNTVKKGSIGSNGNVIPFDKSGYTSEHQDSVRTVKDLLASNSPYSSMISRPSTGVILRNLEWRQSNNQKDWQHLLSAKIGHVFDKQVHQLQQPNTPMPELKLSDVEHAKLERSGVNAHGAENKYLSLTLGETALKGLESLTQSDQKKLNSGQVEAMTPVGRALVYTCHKLVRSSQAVFDNYVGPEANMVHSAEFRPLLNPQHLRFALNLISEYQKAMQEQNTMQSA